MAADVSAAQTLTLSPRMGQSLSSFDATYSTTCGPSSNCATSVNFYWDDGTKLGNMISYYTGSVTMTLAVPANQAPRDHPVLAQQVNGNGVVVASASAPFTVTAPPTPTPTPTPSPTATHNPIPTPTPTPSRAAVATPTVAQTHRKPIGVDGLGIAHALG